ncbi:amidohydrolase family protein [Paludisphaera rhizosphaerae]|uniref:amidohydrolase family protein n=1 Tax=Paludisphaera rhizosphaerae TaxID=2711216 RepID=UPI0013EB029D|nr:amidohydrolase family protein [Paludisphaera rhizosphaerae]
MGPGFTNRRRFLHTALTTSAAAMAYSRVPRAQAGAAVGGPYIDVHTHLGRTWNGDEPMTPEALVRWMDDNNIAKAVVLPLVSPESSSYLNLTEQALAGAKAFPDRLIPFCCIDPRTSYRGGRKGLVAMLKEYVDQGVKGFGEHKVGLPIDDPRMMAAYEACDDLKLPVLFHCDDIRGTDQAGLPGLDRVLTAFPNLNFIGHGPGFWASISGDLKTAGLGSYPKTKVAPGGALDQLFDKHKNLWGDLSAGSGSNAISRDPDFGRGFLIRRADRLLFGTDYLKPGQEVPQFQMLAGFDIPADVRAAIERGNATKLLKL